MNNDYVNPRIFKNILTIRESLTISLRHDFNAFEVILRNLGLVYKDNKNKYTNKNEMMKLQKKILDVIKWLFEQLTNNNKDLFVMKWTFLLRILCVFSDKIYLNDNNDDDDDDDDRFRVYAADEKWIPDFSMINQILGYLIDHKIKCRFHGTVNHPEIYLHFLTSVLPLNSEEFERILSAVARSLSDKNNKYYDCFGKFLIECLIKIDELIINGYKNTYLYMTKATIRKTLSAIKQYDDDMNGRTVFSGLVYVHIPDYLMPVIQMFCEHVSPTSHPNIMKLISVLENRLD